MKETLEETTSNHLKADAIHENKTWMYKRFEYETKHLNMYWQLQKLISLKPKKNGLENNIMKLKS